MTTKHRSGAEGAAASGAPSPASEKSAAGGTGGGTTHEEEGGGQRRLPQHLVLRRRQCSILLLLALAVFGEVCRHPPLPTLPSVFPMIGQNTALTASPGRASSASSSASSSSPPPPPAISGSEESKGPLETTVEERVKMEEGHDECSCYQRYANASCCQRMVLTNHKFGSVLTLRLIRPYMAMAGGIRRVPINPRHLPPEDSRPDYRHVALARNYPEAFVSGYLYHKSGRECWLLLDGTRRPTERYFGWEWAVNQTGFDVGMYPPPNNRSLCRYLADESEEDGMKVYMAIALTKYYRGMDDYYQIAKERRRQHDDRTLFLCLGDYPDPASQRHLFDVLMDWLYPGGHNFTLAPGTINDSPDRNGHASPGNATQRLRLLELVRRFDRDVFNGTVARTGSLLGCSETIRGRRRRGLR